MMRVYRNRIKSVCLIFAVIVAAACALPVTTLAAEPTIKPAISALGESASGETPPPLIDQSPMAKFSQQFQPESSQADLRRRPLLYFRNWANQPLPPVQSFFFLLFVTLLASELMPTRLERARRACASGYWKSLWYGVVACILLTASARALFTSEIGSPLGIVSLAALELFVLLGFAVSATLIGQTLLTTMHLRQTTAAVGRAWVGRLGAAFLGTLILSLIMMIPQIGPLPRIGIRLIMLLCFLGMGALFRTGMGTKEMGSTSEK